MSAKSSAWDFPDGPVVKTPSANVGDSGLIPGLGRFHMPAGQVLQLLKPVLWSPCSTIEATPMKCPHTATGQQWRPSTAKIKLKKKKKEKTQFLAFCGPSMNNNWLSRSDLSVALTTKRKWSFQIVKDKAFNLGFYMLLKNHVSEGAIYIFCFRALSPCLE